MSTSTIKIVRNKIKYLLFKDISFFFDKTKRDPKSFMKTKVIIYFALLVFVVSCQSVEQYNKHRETSISVQKLQEDVNYVQKTLYKLHPSTNLYISKEALDSKFDSIRRVITQPLTPNEFQLLIAPVIASVHQGHMYINPLYKKYTKKEQKQFKKMGDGPITQLGYEWMDNKLVLLKNKTTDKSIKLGSEIISIKSVKPIDLYQKYYKTLTSDGYNTTYIRKAFGKRFSSYLIENIGINDSVEVVFQYKDSVYTKCIKRLQKENKVATKSVAKNDNLNPKENKNSIKKVSTNKIKKNKKIYGFDASKNEYVKSLKFITKDSTTAYVKILNFSTGRYKKAYEKIFDSIQKRGCKTLILDLRDNPGGRISEIVNLYGYFTNSNYTLTQPAIVTSKTSLWHIDLFSRIPKIAYPVAGVFYPVYITYTYLATQKQATGVYTYKLESAYEEQSKANAFKGKMYVLINGGSFSASCLLSSALKTRENVVFVGEETGGDFNGTVAGFMPIKKLPNSKLPWRLGLMDIRPINQTNTKGHGIYPDITLIPTVQDKLKNIDVELNWIINDIEKN